MAIVPDSRIDKVVFYETHLTPWTNNAVAIGLTLPEVAALSIATTDARAAYNTMIAARAAAKAATQSFYTSVSNMHSAPGLGSDMIDTIKNFAQTTDDPNVYTLAQIPPPADPVPAGPPETPTNVSGIINSDGAVELKWKGTLASSTFYEILRKLDGELTWTVIDSVGAKGYLDNTVPVGTASVQYRVRAKRAGFTSAANDPITIRLGVELQTGSGGLSLAA